MATDQPFGSWGHPGLAANPTLPKKPHALLRISPDLVLSMLQTMGQRKITVAGLPDDARVVSVHYGPFDRTILLTLSSETFEPVPDGAHLPYLNPMLTDHGPWEQPEFEAPAEG